MNPNFSRKLLTPVVAFPAPAATFAPAPLTWAVVTAGLRSEDGKTSALRLFDDGRHDEERDGDGIYAGRTADGLKPDDYFVEVHAAAAAAGFVSFDR